MNSVVDSKGQARLVMNTPSAENLAKVSSAMVQGVPADKNLKSQLELTIGRIRYDAQNNRYLYPLSAVDAGWLYYSDAINGWYVDLVSGILFDTTTVSAGGYPTASLLISQLTTLIDRLGVGVADVQDPNGTPAYDENGKPLGKNVKQGLVYRGITATTPG